MIKSAAMATQMCQEHKELKKAYNDFVYEQRAFRAEMLLKENDKYLKLVEGRKKHADPKELDNIEIILEEFAPIQKGLRDYDFDKIEARIKAFPSPYHKYLNAKDRVTIFPVDTTYSKTKQQIEEAPETFLTCD